MTTETATINPEAEAVKGFNLIPSDEAQEAGNEPAGAEESVASGSTEESAPDAPADEPAEQEE